MSTEKDKCLSENIIDLHEVKIIHVLYDQAL